MLERAINDRVQQYEELMSAAHNATLTKWTSAEANHDPEESIQGLNADLRTANEIALSQVLEFADADEE